MNEQKYTFSPSQGLRIWIDNCHCFDSCVINLDATFRQQMSDKIRGINFQKYAMCWQNKLLLVHVNISMVIQVTGEFLRKTGLQYSIKKNYVLSRKTNPLW